MAARAMRMSTMIVISPAPNSAATVMIRADPAMMARTGVETGFADMSVLLGSGGVGQPDGGPDQAGGRRGKGQAGGSGEQGQQCHQAVTSRVPTGANSSAAVAMRPASTPAGMVGEATVPTMRS